VVASDVPQTHVAASREALSAEPRRRMGTQPYEHGSSVSVQRPSRFFGAVGLANWAKKGHPLWPSGAPDPGGIEAISRW
jgi:hypothetical protein